MFEFTLIKGLSKALLQQTGSLLATIFFFMLFTGAVIYSPYKKFFGR